MSRHVSCMALAVSLLAAPAVHAAGPLIGKVEMLAGRPTITINGKPELPTIYALTDFFGGRWSWEETPRVNIEIFAKMGFRLFQVDVWFQDIWTADGKLNVDLVRKQIKGVVDVNPDAAVFLRFHVNSPFWWNLKNPDECVQYADGPADATVYAPPYMHHHRDTQRVSRHSLASEKWKSDATAKLEELLRKLAPTVEARNLVGIQVAGGVYGEWHPWGFPPHDPDISRPMTAYFRKWLGKKYANDAALKKAWADTTATLATAEIPGLAERDKTTAGLFRDPSKERRVMDYYEAQQDTVADAILHFARVVKERWPRPIITGAFYGYYFSTFGRQVAGAHLRMERVFSSPFLDYVSAPQSYYGAAHEMGGSGQSRTLVESARLHGKLYLDEMDQGTTLKKPGDGFSAEDSKTRATFDDDVALLRRNTAHTLMRGMGLWYYDFGAVFAAGNWWLPRFQTEIKRLREIFQARWAKPHTSSADVLFVFDTEYLYGFAPRWNVVNDALIDLTPALAYRSGAMLDAVLLTDLPRVDLNRYKAIVFANTLQMSAEQRAFVKDKVAHAGRHLVWLYMPAYSDGQTLDDQRVSEITGIAQKRYDYAAHAAKDPKKPGSPVDPKIVVVDATGFPKITFGLGDPLNPMMVVDDKSAQPVAVLDGTREVVVARKALTDSTAWVATLSAHSPELLRGIFRQAGAHIYNEGNDSVLVGSGILMIHTVDGGKRTIKLRSGKAIETTLAPRSTILFDAETGEALLN